MCILCVSATFAFAPTVRVTPRTRWKPPEKESQGNYREWSWNPDELLHCGLNDAWSQMYLSLTVQVFSPWHWLPWKHLLLGFVLRSCDSLHLPTSKFGTSGYESKSCCFFSLFIFLPFLKDEVMSFMPEWKLEVSPYFFYYFSFLSWMQPVLSVSCASFQR